ncbi:CRISPR-associated DxTHG motif protein [Candidatus Saccharibacteria bacterium]|nr:CRISPR-associated DxTHG motif protein [Candidatus Saccharibacteria bacterium]
MLTHGFNYLQVFYQAPLY